MRETDTRQVNTNYVLMQAAFLTSEEQGRLLFDPTEFYIIRDS